MKTYKSKAPYQGTYKKVSRWIKIEYIKVTNRNFDVCNEVVKVSKGYYVPSFTYKGKRYYLNNFLKLPTPLEIDNEEKSLVIGYDYKEFYKPLEIEISADCEGVRLWQEV